MFREWGFLLAEIWVLLALAAVLGLFVGWLFWGAGRRRRSISAALGNRSAAAAEILRLKAALETCTAERNRALARVATLGAGLEAAGAALGPQSVRAGGDQGQKLHAPVTPEGEAAPEVSGESSTGSSTGPSTEARHSIAL